MRENAKFYNIPFENVPIPLLKIDVPSPNRQSALADHLLRSLYHTRARFTHRVCFLALPRMREFHNVLSLSLDQTRSLSRL